MIVEYSPEGVVTLAELDDFRNFKIMLKGGAEPKNINGLTFLEAGNALVDIDLVPRLAGASGSAVWRTRYDNMIVSATILGWIDIEKSAIRAHVALE